jgi:cytoskeletal protein RodZ
MAAFQKKEIREIEKPGKLFFKKRNEKNLTLLKISREIGISEKYLEAMEGDDWQLLPGEFYIKTFAKKYAEFLGVRWKRIEKQISGEAEYFTKCHGRQLPPKVPARKIFFDINSFGKKIILIFFVLALIVYLYFQSSYVMKAPEIKIFSPPTETFYTENETIILAGQTVSEIVVMINNLEVTSDKEGFFSSHINLSPGINVIKVSAKKRYSKTSEKEIKIVLNRN